jgi:glycosyltransferase involved in cell wall biosynthesis
MAKTEKFNGGISIASNSYGVPTGYGQQVQQIADRFLKHGLKVANISNYGLEGSISTIRTKNGSIQHYPKGFKPYSDDVIPLWHEHFKQQNPNMPHVLLTLYDTWVFKDMKYDGDIWAWTPIDHTTIPPKVLEVLRQENIKPISMALHGHREMNRMGIDNVYIPHGVDTKVYKPTAEWQGQNMRELMEVPEDAFLVTIMAANKANGILHRKSLAESLLAFSIFRQEEKYKNSFLYLHMEPSNAFGGFRLPALLKACGLDEESVRIADSAQLRTGYPQEALAALYSASDVVMAAALGEGFGLGTIEAQACGTRVIGSGWTASPDLLGPSSFQIEGQPFWNETQQAWWQVPLLTSLIQALRLAHQEERGTDQASVDFAKQYDADHVFENNWLPFLRERFA